MEHLLTELIQAINNQTAAINNLVESNQRIMMAMLDQEEIETPATRYMDGTNAG